MDREEARRSDTRRQTQEGGLTEEVPTASAPRSRPHHTGPLDSPPFGRLYQGPNPFAPHNTDQGDYPGRDWPLAPTSLYPQYPIPPPNPSHYLPVNPYDQRQPLHPPWDYTVNTSRRPPTSSQAFVYPPPLQGPYYGQNAPFHQAAQQQPYHVLHYHPHQFNAQQQRPVPAPPQVPHNPFPVVPLVNVHAPILTPLPSPPPHQGLQAASRHTGQRSQEEPPTRIPKLPQRHPRPKRPTIPVFAPVASFFASRMAEPAPPRGVRRQREIPDDNEEQEEKQGPKKRRYRRPRSPPNLNFRTIAPRPRPFSPPDSPGEDPRLRNKRATAQRRADRVSGAGDGRGGGGGQSRGRGGAGGKGRGDRSGAAGDQKGAERGGGRGGGETT